MSAANFGSAQVRCGAMLGFAGPVTQGGRLPLLLASMGINLLGLALPIFILQIYDRVLPNAATTTLFALIAITISAAFGASTTRKAKSWRFPIWLQLLRRSL